MVREEAKGRVRWESGLKKPYWHSGGNQELLYSLNRWTFRDPSPLQTVTLAIKFQHEFRSLQTTVQPSESGICK